MSSTSGEINNSSTEFYSEQWSLIATVVVSSKDEYKWVTLRPGYIHKALETLKKNEEIERRGF